MIIKWENILIYKYFYFVSNYKKSGCLKELVEQWAEARQKMDRVDDKYRICQFL